MFGNIRTNLGFVLGLLVLIGLGSVGTTLWIVKSQAVDALVINLAGRQRLLIASTAKRALAEAQRGQATLHLSDAHAAAHEWQQNFEALRDGGEVTYQNRVVTLPPTTDPTIRAQLAAVRRAWLPFYTALHTILENPPDSPAFAQSIGGLDELSESVVAEMDHAVQLYEAAAAERVARVERAQVAFLLTGAVVVGLGLVLIHWQIIRPLAGLEQAVRRMRAGDLETRVSVTVKNELGEFAVAFDDLRQHLAALYALSRALADTNDRDAIFSLITRAATELVGATFVHILLWQDGALVLGAIYPLPAPDDALQVGQRIPDASLAWVQRALKQNASAVLSPAGATLPEPEQVVWLQLAPTALLVALRAEDRALGLMVLGQARRDGAQALSSDLVGLARGIGDQAASALRRAQLFAELENAYLQTVLALVNAIDAKDTYTANHALQLTRMALAVGEAVGLDANILQDLRYGAILHDVGKIGVPDTILQKSGALNCHEWDFMRAHPVIGERILAPVPRLAGAARIVRHHHERFDGTGYPDGLQGQDIPLAARILSVVDAYSAMIDRRVYKEACPHEQACAEIVRNAGTQFDPQVVRVFMRVLETKR